MTDEIKRKINQINSDKIPEGYSKRRWILYPNDWNYVKLNTCLSENKERNKDGVYTKDDVLSVSGESGVVNQIEFMGRSYAGESVLPYHVVETGDIVYTKSPLKQNPYGIIKLNKGNPGIVSTLYAVYHCCNPITAEYLNYFFEIDEYLNSYLFPLVKKGAKNDMKVNNEDVIKGEIALPPIEEQEEIVKILKQCDNVIKLKRKRIEEEKKLKKALMQKLLNPDSGIRLPGFKCEWKKTCIGDITELYSGGTPKSSEIENYADESGIPFIRSGEISSTYTELFLSEIGYKNSSAKMVKKGDLLYALYGANSGDCFISKMDGAINQAILCIKSKSEDIRYIYYVLSNSREKITSIYLQGGQGNLSATIIKKLKIDLPSPEEQRAIVSALNSKDTIIENLEKELEQWQHKKKSLMQLLLTGIVRVK